MMAITGEEVISAMATNLTTIVPTTLSALYKETPTQQAVKPYAFLHQVNGNFSNEMRGRGQMDFMVDVRVHPVDNKADAFEWCRATALKIILLINVITISSQAVKSRTLTWRVEEGVLHVIVTYSFKVVVTASTIPDMQDLQHGERIK